MESSVPDEWQNHVECTAPALRGHSALKATALIFHGNGFPVPSRASEAQHMEEVLRTLMKTYILLYTTLGSTSMYNDEFVEHIGI